MGTANGDAMLQYHVRLFSGAVMTEDGVRHDTPQDTVVREAKSAVESGHADRAEVRNVQGNLIFQWPRTLNQ
jgi:hypothetical protein